MRAICFNPLLSGSVFLTRHFSNCLNSGLLSFNPLLSGSVFLTVLTKQGKLYEVPYGFNPLLSGSVFLTLLGRLRVAI